MRRTLPYSFLSVLLATACVTINVYFPAAAAEKAADRIIDDVWRAPKVEAPEPAIKTTPLSQVQRRAPWWIAVLNAAVAPAQAADGQQPNIDISSPEVQRVKASMESRFAALKPHLDSGAVGLTGDGLVTLREANAVPLAQRASVKSLVAAENKDRQALYKEIAVANGQPQWEGQIQSVFAQRWVAKAQKGWWYETASGWAQK